MSFKRIYIIFLCNLFVKYLFKRQVKNLIPANNQFFIHIIILEMHYIYLYSLENGKF